MTITVQGLAAVAKICPTAGNLSQVVSNLSNHLVHAHHTQAIGAEGTALMALSGHGLHSLNADTPLGENGSEPLSHHDAPRKKFPLQQQMLLLRQRLCDGLCAFPPNGGGFSSRRGLFEFHGAPA